MACDFLKLHPYQKSWIHWLILHDQKITPFRVNVMGLIPASAMTVFSTYHPSESLRFKRTSSERRKSTQKWREDRSVF